MVLIFVIVVDDPDSNLQESEAILPDQKADQFEPSRDLDNNSNSDGFDLINGIQSNEHEGDNLDEVKEKEEPVLAEEESNVEEQSLVSEDM